MGGHLEDNHGIIYSRVEFDLAITVFILRNSSLRSLEVNEHLFIHKLRTLKPNGINSLLNIVEPCFCAFLIFHSFHLNLSSLELELLFSLLGAEDVMKVLHLMSIKIFSRFLASH